MASLDLLYHFDDLPLLTHNDAGGDWYAGELSGTARIDFDCADAWRVGWLKIDACSLGKWKAVFVENDSPLFTLIEAALRLHDGEHIMTAIRKALEEDDSPSNQRETKAEMRRRGLEDYAVFP